MPRPRPSMKPAALLIAACGLLSTPSRSMAGTAIPVASFRSITLEGGGEVIVHYGTTQRVMLSAGRMECTSVKVVDGELQIEGPHGRCRGEYNLLIEVQTPEVSELMVMDGGTLRTAGSFPSQKELLGRVENGGRLDIRSMKVATVRAAIRQGGAIFTKPQANLLARIEQGGAVTYWGKPEVQSSIEHGGMVASGKAGDANKPLSQLVSGAETMPPIPPIPPVPTLGD